jgi:hypothetical protein
MIQGGYPPQLVFFGKNCSGFENLIILRHLEAELIILRCLTLIRGYFYFLFFFTPLKLIYGGNPGLVAKLSWVYKT